MTSGSILVCRDARASYWQLGPLPPAHGRLALVAWSPGAATNDSGVPPEVARILARTWTSIARVTFPSSMAMTATHEWTEHDFGLVRRLAAPGLLERAMARLRRSSADATLVSTRLADVAERLFDDTAFPWWLQGQVVLLSDLDGDPPDLDEASLRSLLSEDWVDRAAALEPLGVQGVLRPAVDGDVAGLLALSEGFESRHLDTLERETRAANLTWSLVSEQTLGR